MKIVAEIVAAVILLLSASYIAPKAIQEFRKETLKKVDGGIAPISSFTKNLTK